MNEGTTDTMQNNMGMVVVPPLPPGRMLNVSWEQRHDRDKRGLMLAVLHSISSGEMFLDLGPQVRESEEEAEIAVTVFNLVAAWRR